MTELERAMLHIKTRADAWAVKVVKDALSQEPCTDAVSREAVYSILKEYHLDEEEIESAMDECQNLTVNGIASDVSLLPSVTQKSAKDYLDMADRKAKKIKDALTVTQKSGKWINDKDDMPTCSECGYIPQYDRAIDDYEYSNFCPNCGCRMFEPQESEDKE